MKTNPYEYDRTIPWIPQQNQFYQGSYITTPTNRQPSAMPNHQRPQQRVVNHKPNSSQRMPKVQALALARTLKKGIVIASLVSFGTLSGLVAFHQITGATNQVSSGSSHSTSSSTSTSTSSSQSSNSLLNQQGGNNFGSSNSSQAPVSGSTVS
jgi:hypothetical protein